MKYFEVDLESVKLNRTCYTTIIHSNLFEYLSKTPEGCLTSGVWGVFLVNL